jgi:3,4-dihydroxy 2-butanone 4-phosphate synthase/GTP cyclohydrolase II
MSSLDQTILRLPERAQKHQQQRGRPFVTLTYAQSLDGSITSRPGQRLTLSGEASLLMTHQLRSVHSAIMVGINTILADDPTLTARRVGGPHPQPAILDSHLRTPMTARILERQPLIFCIESAPHEAELKLSEAGAQIVRLPATLHQRIDLNAMLNWLSDHGANSLMVEGGAGVITSFLQEGLADWLVITVAPLLVGGVNALTGFLNTGDGTFPHLQNVESTQLDQDTIIWGELAEQLS